MKNRQKFFLSSFFLLSLTLLATKTTPPEKKEELDSEDQKYSWIKTTADVISLIEEKGFRKSITFGDCIQDALKAYLAKIDAHTRFFTSEGHQSIKETASGKFSGIGVSITGKALEDDSLVLIDVIEGGPAHKAGLMTGDKIFEVDGTKLQGLSSDEAVSKLKGKQGTTVHLKIIRHKKPLDFKVKRDVIKDEASMWYHFKDHDVYYCALKIFSEPAAQQMKKMLIKINNAPCKGIIIDLRNNPGGILESAIDMAGLFIPKGSLVTTTKNNKNQVMVKCLTQHEPVFKKEVPIFIITNNFTASAAEILAGCLRHYANNASEKKELEKHNNQSALQVFLVGTTTHGKGSVQEVIPVGQGCAMKLTTMLYYLPDDSSIQAVGIEPDFIIKPKNVPEKELKWIEDAYGRENSIKNHITALEVKKITGIPVTKEEEEQENKKKKKQKENSEEDPENDMTPMSSKQLEERRKKDLNQNVQVQICINMINLFSLAKKSTPKLINTRKKALEFFRTHALTDSPAQIEIIKDNK